MSEQYKQMTSSKEKIVMLKSLLWDLVQKFPESDKLSYAKPDASWKLLMEIVGCYLDRIPMNELPRVLLQDNPSDLAMFRINWIKNKAVEEMKEPIVGMQLIPDGPEYPEGYSQEIKMRDSEVGPDPDIKGQLLENIEKISALEKELSAAKDVIRELSEERDLLSEQMERQSESSSKQEKHEANREIQELEKERDYWKLQFEEMENVQRQHAAQNNIRVSKQYKLSKLAPVDFLNNLIATESYSMEQLTFIQHCLMQKVPVSIISKCVSAAFPVSFMEDYIKYQCKKKKISYQPLHLRDML